MYNTESTNLAERIAPETHNNLISIINADKLRFAASAILVSMALSPLIGGVVI
jgi:hypothetical protein